MANAHLVSVLNLPVEIVLGLFGRPAVRPGRGTRSLILFACVHDRSDRIAVLITLLIVQGASFMTKTQELDPQRIELSNVKSLGG
jgi:hypothetical protein